VRGWIVAIALVAGACAPGVARHDLPSCSGPSSAVVLMAQSVPDAALVPCIDSLRTGWSFRRLDATDERASFALDSDRVGERFLTVTFSDRCPGERGREVESDEPGTRLFRDEVPSESDEYRARWTYEFEGGCVTYDFDADGAESTPTAGYVADLLSFVEVEER